MKVWVETRTVEYPTGTVSGRFGSSVMFVAYERWRRRWIWVQPNSVVEKIPEPQAILVDEKWARKHTLKTPRGKRERPTIIRRRKGGEQLTFEL